MPLDESKYKELKLDREDRLLTITLNRPEARNALTDGMHKELESIWQDIAVDDSIGAVILTGAGDRAFSAGGDVKSMSQRSASGPPPIRNFVGPKRILANMFEVEQPIIGAINGDCVGLGASLAFSCDIIVASDRARFADTHVKVGLVAGDGGVVNWPLMMGIHKAKEYLLTGDWLHAPDAERLGMINYAVPYEDVMPKAREIALKLANGPVWAIRWTKTSVNKIIRDRLNLVMDTSLATEWLSMQTEDHKEATAAFVEKRQASFKGR
jgi:enoyl-CoA hydratase/carnithine racemase